MEMLAVGMAEDDFPTAFSSDSDIAIGNDGGGVSRQRRSPSRRRRPIVIFGVVAVLFTVVGRLVVPLLLLAPLASPEAAQFGNILDQMAMADEKDQLAKSKEGMFCQKICPHPPLFVVAGQRKKERTHTEISRKKQAVVLLGICETETQGQFLRNEK